MNWLDKLERKFGRYAIPNLTVYLLAGYVIGFAVYYLAPNLLRYLTLEPYYILHGQIWRIISWVLIPPTGSLFSLFFLVLLYYSLGTALERTWGTFRYNVYIFSGIFFTVIAVFILYGVFYLIYGVALPMSSIGLISTNYITMSIFLAFASIYPDMEVMLYFILPIKMSIFLAFACMYPDMQVLLMFIIPIKMKWMALVYAAMALYYFLTGSLAVKVAIGASLLNFVIFFCSSRNIKRFGPKEQARKAKFRQQSRPHMTYSNGARHRCAVCGRTELDDPNLEFRFCSKCNGNYEYCQDHLFTHQHIK